MLQTQLKATNHCGYIFKFLMKNKERKNILISLDDVLQQRKISFCAI